MNDFVDGPSGEIEGRRLFRGISMKEQVPMFDPRLYVARFEDDATDDLRLFHSTQTTCH